ncbi:glucosaminidase domain-containing protein [Sulfurimonas sp.]|uniref:glucosaminidase domain-containing protein n=1 Tax=Sulfurimonas sp. TaxID=2022749 RepID=UPI00260B7B84|nr:glucosaminidase domain-containing protein [Sulfurimonas sp.]
MDYLLALLLAFQDEVSQTQLLKPKYLAHVVPKDMSIQTKKKRFLYLVVPPTQNVHKKLMQRYKRVAQDIKNARITEEIASLKKEYGATSDEDLLARLKPHPISITLAQAAMESSWATSRFFNEANNIFGMWSTDPKQERIAAGQQREGNVTIWLRKFDTIDDSIKAYYDLISKAKAYAKLRKLRLETNDPFIITQGLDKYSEIGQAYIDEINSVIRHNNFTKYDKE